MKKGRVPRDAKQRNQRNQSTFSITYNGTSRGTATEPTGTDKPCEVPSGSALVPSLVPLHQIDVLGWFRWFRIVALGGHHLRATCNRNLANQVHMDDRGVLCRREDKQ